MSNTIIHRLNRIQGQIEAIKNTLSSEEKPSPKELAGCKEVLYQIKATRNALKKAGDEYITQYVQTCLENTGGTSSASKKQKEEIKELLQTAFNL